MSTTLPAIDKIFQVLGGWPSIQLYTGATGWKCERICKSWFMGGGGSRYILYLEGAGIQIFFEARDLYSRYVIAFSLDKYSLRTYILDPVGTGQPCHDFKEDIEQFTGLSLDPF